MSDHHASSGSQKPVVSAIFLLVVLYVLALVMHWPPVAGHDAAEIATEEVAATSGEAETPPPAGHDPRATPHASSAHPKREAPPFYTVTPFVLLLLSIAVLPLLPGVNHWWESNRNRFIVAAGLGLITLLWYLSSRGSSDALHTLEHALLGEFVPFIVLLFSLYTISGGIRIECDLKAHPIVNTAFIAVGGLLASFIGTTGAAMLLIRPLLETNSERRHVRHSVIFFIFVVCNCGGCLLPIGDPPLFLGYLRGVPFFWTLQLWSHWLFVNGALLAVYFMWDTLAYRKETKQDIVRDETHVRPIRISGLELNGLLLIGVIASVALLDPNKALPGTDWRAPNFLREIVQLSLVGVSLLAGSTAIRQANRFNFHAIVEVAALFFGIFICMQPALEILNIYGRNLGIDTPQKFFWITGSLSSVLDNAPTYVVFFETAKTMSDAPGPGILQLVDGKFLREDLLVAISLGAVFLGAMTYIGNGPNFMVKAIAEQSGIRMPSFFGYIAYSVGVLIPIFVLMTLLFL